MHASSHSLGYAWFNREEGSRDMFGLEEGRYFNYNHVWLKGEGRGGMLNGLYVAISDNNFQDLKFFVAINDNNNKILKIEIKSK